MLTGNDKRILEYVSKALLCRHNFVNIAAVASVFFLLLAPL